MRTPAALNCARILWKVSSGTERRQSRISARESLGGSMWFQPNSMALKPASLVARMAASRGRSRKLQPCTPISTPEPLLAGRVKAQAPPPSRTEPNARLVNVLKSPPLSDNLFLHGIPADSLLPAVRLDGHDDGGCLLEGPVFVAAGPLPAAHRVDQVLPVAGHFELAAFHGVIRGRRAHSSAGLEEFAQALLVLRLPFGAVETAETGRHLDGAVASQVLRDLAHVVVMEVAVESDGKLAARVVHEHVPHVRHFLVRGPVIEVTLGVAGLGNTHLEHHVDGIPEVAHQVAGDAVAVFPPVAPAEEALHINGTLGDVGGEARPIDSVRP